MNQVDPSRTIPRQHLGHRHPGERLGLAFATHSVNECIIYVYTIHTHTHTLSLYIYIHTWDTVRISVDFFSKEAPQRWQLVTIRECIQLDVNQANIVVYLHAMGKIDEDNSTCSARVSCSCHIIYCPRWLSRCFLQPVCFLPMSQSSRIKLN